VGRETLVGLSSIQAKWRWNNILICIPNIYQGKVKKQMHQKESKEIKSTVHQKIDQLFLFCYSLLASLTADTNRHCEASLTLIGCTVDLGGMPYSQRYKINIKMHCDDTKLKTKVYSHKRKKQRTMSTSAISIADTPNAQTSTWCRKQEHMFW